MVYFASGSEDLNANSTLNPHGFRPLFAQWVAESSFLSGYHIFGSCTFLETKNTWVKVPQAIGAAHYAWYFVQHCWLE